MQFLTFASMLRRAAWRTPDRPFLYWSDRQRSITYAEGDRISDAAAGALWDLGVRKGDRVGIFAHNGLDYVTAMFGIWKTGAVSAHISVLQADNLAWFVQDSAPTVLIYTGDLHHVIERDRAQMPSLRHIICYDGARPGAQDWNSLIAAEMRPPAVEIAGEDPAHLSYTSGSSGKPKGAVLAHGYTARATHAIAERLGIEQEDISLGPTSLASSYQLVGNLLPAVHRSAYIGVRKTWNPAEVWEEMESRAVTYAIANPLLLADLLRESRLRGRKPTALRFVVSGGAPVPPDLKKAFQDELNAPLVESYGQSELGGFVALGYPRAESGLRLLSIGRELPDREVIIADENDREVPRGQPGEMLIRGGVMLGYHGLPEKTAEVLRGGWLHTGDMGIMEADGYIRMIGRWSERIVTRGKIIYPRAMEEALLRHPAVRYACVIARLDPQAGQLAKAVVELHAGQSAGESELLAHARAVLGADAPPLLEIIPVMPMTPTGKLARAELQARENAL
jgi:acyl-CoA synthetase (AMP-forming)/AMP-acid ligase II